MERQLALGSRFDLPRDDRIELAAQARGAINFIDFILTGGVDEMVRKLLDIPNEIPQVPEDYMAHEWAQEERKQ